MRTKLLFALLLAGSCLTEAQAHIDLTPNPNAPKAAQRIRPAAATFYDYTIEKEPGYYYKYDVWGNRTERERNGYYNIQTWDNSKGYPILLDSYSYRVNDDGTRSEDVYTRRTTLDGSGVRTSLYILNSSYWNYYDDYLPLDAEGHLTSYPYKDDKYEQEQYDLTWDGDRIATFKHEFVYEEPASSDYYAKWVRSEDLTNIEIVHETKPFNAYDVLQYYELFRYPQESGVWISADGTGKEEHYSNGVLNNDPYNCSGPMKIRSTVSDDKKRLTKTVTIDGKLMNYEEVVYIDENGSYKYTYTKRGLTSRSVYSCNEYGDLISRVYIPDDTRSQPDSTLYEWKYDNEGRPLEVREYYKSHFDGKKEPKDAYVFTAWHDGSSITATEATEPRILGATLYTPDGKKVRTLTAEEAQAADRLTAPQRGIYLLVTQTDRGVETRKLIK